MTLKQVLKEIKRHTWWSEEAPGVPMFCIWVRQFVEQSKFWHPRLPTILIGFFKKDYVYEETPEDEKLKIWYYVWQRHLRDPLQQRKQYKRWRGFIQQLEKEGDSFLAHRRQWSAPELADSLERFAQCVADYWRMTWVQESADIFTSYELPKILQKEIPDIPAEKLTDIALTLSSPVRLSFMEEMRADIMKFCIRWYKEVKNCRVLTKAPKSLQQDIKLIVRRYVWILSNYKIGVSATPNYFWRQTQDECRNKHRKSLLKELRMIQTKVARTKKAKAAFLRSLSLSKSLRAAFDLLSFWSGWTDERKRGALIANWYLEYYAQEIAKRLKWNIWKVKSMTLEEIDQALRQQVFPRPLVLDNRRKFSAFVEYKVGRKRVEHIFVGKDARLLWNTLFGLQKIKEICGQVASAPVKMIRGRVQVVLDVSKARFKTGSILVVTMTRPEFMPLMHRASAIITDEGGLTSHAAIVSRELGIPCIIGTKIATKVLKDGDLVEVDATKGIVRKL